MRLASFWLKRSLPSSIDCTVTGAQSIISANSFWVINNNSEIPIALYGVVQFSSASGLRELFQLSRTALGPEFEKAVKALAGVLNRRAASAVSGFVTFPCNNCSGHVEFPAEGVGQTIACPHCGLDTLLFRPAVA